MMKKSRFSTIDEYISSYPEDVQEILQKLRKAIKTLAPNSIETISYQIPTFKLNGILVHFAAYKNHIGFYPTPSAINEFQNEFGNFEFSKGSIKFPIRKPIPMNLIKRIVEFKIKENTPK